MSRAEVLCLYGGVPERPNGAVLKTADRRKAVRGFKSHPRRLAEPKTRNMQALWLCGRGLFRPFTHRLEPLKTAYLGWRLVQNWCANGQRASAACYCLEHCA